MRGGFRIRKKQLKQAGWQVVGESKSGDREYQLVLRNSDGNERTITLSRENPCIREFGRRSEADLST